MAPKNSDPGSKRQLLRQKNKAANSSFSQMLSMNDKRVWYGLGFLALFCGVAFFQLAVSIAGVLGGHAAGSTGFSTPFGPPSLPKLDVTDHSEEGIQKMKEVFFGGGAYGVWCVDKEMPGVPKIIMEIKREMASDKVGKDAVRV